MLSPLRHLHSGERVGPPSQQYGHANILFIQSRDERHHPPQVCGNPTPSADARVILPWEIFICQHLLNSPLPFLPACLAHAMQRSVHIFTKLNKKWYIYVRSSLGCIQNLHSCRKPECGSQEAARRTCHCLNKITATNMFVEV